MKQLIMAAGLAVMLTACGTSEKKTVEGENPFFAEYTTPFGVPPFDQIKFEHYKPALLQGMEEGRKEIEAIVNNPEEPTFENTIVALDEQGALLRKVQIVFGGQNSVNTNDEMQALSREMSPLLSKYSDDINLNPKLFARVKAVYDKKDELGLDKEQMKLLEETYKDFVRGGANLSAEDQAKLRELNSKISMLQLTFGQNMLKETNAFKLVIDKQEDLSGLPETLIANAAQAAKDAGMEGKWVFTLQNPSVMPFLQYSDKRELREKMFNAYINRGNNNNENDNKEVVRDLVAARLAKAKLMGYDDYASFVLDEIYHTYAKSLVERGLAYPCFCTEEELDKVRAKQEEDKVLTGYYGEYATCRNLSYEEVEANIKAGKPYVLRLRSQGSPDKEITFVDAIKGEIKLPENIHDIVLLKKDGIPTYHFAHAIDDHLMRTTTVVRGGEWLASAPIHYELFHLLGFKMPAYAHTAHLMKFDEETGGKRKLSKRKDPELSLDYYRKDGYHPYTMKVYLLTLLNSNFEEWHEKFPDKDINEFPFSVEKMNQSGALFDKDKLHNICKNELSKLSEEELYDFLYDWAKENEPENVEKWFGDREKMLQILRLYMGVGAKRRRKDLMYAKQIFELISYFFDGESAEEMDEFKLDEDMVSKILKSYLAKYDHNDDNSVWFNKLKEIADEHGFASDMKAYKANPENFKGNVSDIAEAVRIAVTGRANTPDLWTIVHIMGEEQMTERIKKHIK